MDKDKDWENFEKALTMLFFPFSIPAKILAAPLTAPIKGFLWMAEKINDVAQKELTDKGKIQEQLLELQMRFEMEEIDEEEYNKKEAELMERLEQIRKLEEEK